MEEQKYADADQDPHSGAWRLQISSEHRLRSENLAFDIDVWYPILEPFTFKTVFLPLKRREAIAIIHYYQTRYIKNAADSDPVLTVYDIKILTQLETEIAAILNNPSNKFVTNGAFMRMCGRSPKDAEPLNREHVRALYNQNLQDLLTGNNPENVQYPENGNTKLMAIARTQWLKITEAKDAMNQLLSSERVYTDLHDWIRYGEPEQIVFRVWQNGLSLDYEFRCFVYNNRITAISQYDHYAIYPFLESQKEAIQALMVAKWQEVHEYILQDHYVIDFGYLPEKREVVVIEISPFRTCTGAACFNWKVDHDIMYGVDESAEIEFRLKEKLHPQIDDLVEANWELRWFGNEPDPEPYWKLYDRVKANWKEEIEREEQKKGRRTCQMYGIMVFLLLVLVAIIAVVWYYTRFWGIVLTVAVFIGVLLLAVYLCLHRCYDVVKKDEMEKRLVLSEDDEAEKPLKYMEFDPRQGHLAEIKQIDERINDQTFVLFVYGTLKRGFHWNHKFMSRGSKFIGTASTVDRFAVVMGDCNVPYVLDLSGDADGDKEEKKESEIGENILGEVWHIDYETLIGLDDYEGVTKGHYKRKKINVRLDVDEEQTEIVKANIYMKADVSNIDLSEATLLKEYSYEYHKKNYSPIKHIQVKQLAYLGEDFSRT